ncbi:MAG TPA: oxidoreductase [Nocardioidaceae bacterium]|nr:oxidoreductase [Nocardioidaceae bacterium]
MSDELRILVLGGTSWLGGHVAKIGVSRGHGVTCLARGESGSVPAGAQHVVADRHRPDAYDVVAEQDWDAVVDVTWQPQFVRSALASLASRTPQWIYVSSISVYADHSLPGADESADLLPTWSGSGTASIEEYGEAKVSCETACREVVGSDRLLVARAGLIVGYGDRSDRFGYWPARFAQSQHSEPVLVPPHDMPVQVIDVLDLAGWLVDSAERGVTGVYDAVGEQLSFADVSASCVAVTGASPDLVDPGEDWLLEAEVSPWAGPDSLPLWLPRESHAGMVSRPGTAARTAGLTPRPLSETAAEALRWERERGLGRERSAGLSRQREADLLARVAGTR